MLRVLGLRALGRNFSWGSKPPEEIVRSGIYHHMTHPLVVGYALQTIAMAVAGNGSASLKFVPILAVVIAAWAQIRREEREIRKCFGKS